MMKTHRRPQSQMSHSGGPTPRTKQRTRDRSHYERTCRSIAFINDLSGAECRTAQHSTIISYLPAPFLLSYSVFDFYFSLFFVSGPCARLSWPSRQLFSARKSTVSYRIVSYYSVIQCMYTYTEATVLSTRLPSCKP